MKLWQVENGYWGNGPIHVLIVAPTRARALELAGAAFSADSDRHRIAYDETYWMRLEARELCSDTSAEWTGRVDD